MKQSYTLTQNVKYFFKTVYKQHPIVLVFVGMNVIIGVAITVITAMLPSMLIGLLTQHATLQGIVLPMLAVTLVLAIIAYRKVVLEKQAVIARVRVRLLDFGLRIAYKYLNMDFEKIEDDETFKTYRRAVLNSVASNTAGTESLVVETERLLINAMSLIVFGMFLSTFNPLAFILTLVVGLLNAWLLRYERNYREKTKTAWSTLDAQKSYLKNDAIKSENGKDARIYNVGPLYNRKVEAMTHKRLQFHKKTANIQWLNRFIADIAILGRDIFIYVFLVKATLNGSMSIAEFTLFFTVMNSFNIWIQQIVDACHLIGLGAQDITDLRAYLDIEEHSGGRPLPLQRDHYTICFHEVSYRYPEMSKDTLTNLTFCLNTNESIALVGVNGAGKTTIVKLLLGLIQPTTGSITLNGQDISQYDRKDYFKYFSPAFQENDVWALTLLQNVVLRRDRVDEKRVLEVLEQAGLGDFVASLPKGLDTNMTTNIHLDGTNLSGGQTQKLMLARALYKDAPILVLDEPTAALDAIAEKQLYEQYKELSGHKSSLFISHRLSSTRFCDRILFLEAGQIIESGTHDMLMDCKGKYAEMFEIQSQYYKEESGHEKISTHFEAHSEA